MWLLPRQAAPARTCEGEELRASGRNLTTEGVAGVVQGLNPLIHVFDGRR